MKILITGAGGQDGVLLIKRILASMPNANICALGRNEAVFLERLHLVGGASLVDTFQHKSAFIICDITNCNQVKWQIEKIRPNVIFHLAAYVEPILQPENDVKVTLENMKGLIYILQACEQIKIYPHIINAGSSLMFGVVESGLANEKTPFRPITPYGIGKLAAHQFADIYRTNRNHRVSTAILFNHESILRDERWLPTKIISGAVRIKFGKSEHLKLGEINVGRDWSAAEDIVDGLFKIFEKDAVNEDFTLGSGVVKSVSDLLTLVFTSLELEWQNYVISDENLERTNDVGAIQADISKAQKVLGWSPRISTSDWVGTMINYHKSIQGLK